ncbi:HEAT repeat domain-containing protein [Dyadobacter fermentans]|uniref:HEAT repeat domain-containing protein n=1 Tax=Dyadobacter fermentans TaxID=94254 RepID=UPI001CBD0C62|nr:HEAT repeat domain-containing protein [Dyadobacter fermentans]MBZ1359771.1 sister chromatid cohesion protein PDS5 [Dyadobacter fermentans]
MAFYDLSKSERADRVRAIQGEIKDALLSHNLQKAHVCYSDDDTYIRKSAYLVTGRLYSEDVTLRPAILAMLLKFMSDPDFKVRQTVINAAGEIGKWDFEGVRSYFDEGLKDRHHSPRNAVIGSVKKMGEVNPEPVLAWAREYLHHQDKEIRREICHGIELRGRKYPEDILPLLAELQHDRTARVRNTLVHVIGQIAYKKGCLAKVLAHLESWENRPLVDAALEEIIDVHHRYRNFTALTQAEAITLIDAHYPDRKRKSGGMVY